MLQTEKKVFLNGEWDFMPVYDNPYICDLPEKLIYEEEKCIVPSSWRKCLVVEKYEFEPMNVFHYPERWNDATAGILHRQFTVPENMKNERIYLGFDAIGHKSVVFLNGEKLTEWYEIFLPLHIDITDKVNKDGINDIYVVCSEFEKSVIPDGTEKSTGLVGSWFGVSVRGIWQDAYLYTKPHVNISDLEIITSVKNKAISIYVSVLNTTEKSESLTALIEIKDGNDVVKTMKKEFDVPANSEIETEIIKPWDNPVYWDTENPHLYIMEVSLKRNDEVIETVSERFGFRELWAEGQNFILNGTRINLRGDSWHFQGAGQQTKEYALNWCRLCKENGANSIRYHAEPHPEYYLDAADETGILIVDETAIYGSGKTMDAASPEYLRNCRDHIKQFVKRDKNHASVVIWSLQNEMRWVDGRDEYKKHVPEFMDIFHNNDRSGRLISLDGDNRLIDKEHTEVASLHYNIDGTIDQWDRKTPLTIGEHGGLWYICPQNSSMYLGMGTYNDSEYCAEGISLKEQLFMEYARKEQVSGISSFNFAHYFAKSMPEKDIFLPEAPLDTEGVKPRVIPKYSLTINNGKLPEKYPYYTPNVTCKYATEGMRPITVFCDEYNHSFYDDNDITRHLYVFNDTLKEKDVTLIIKAVAGDRVLLEKTEKFSQAPGEYIVKEISFTPCSVTEKTELIFTCELYHYGELMYTMKKNYSLYPASIKSTAVTDKKVAFYGSEDDYRKVLKLAPDSIKIDIADTFDADILVIGSYIDDEEKSIHNKIEGFINAGGNVIILEQFSYSFGSMVLNKKDFLRAHTGDYSHPVLNGLGDNDLIFWHEKAYEAGPVPFITAAFEKPITGNFTMILECSFGDFGDGGDLWSPMLEYKSDKGIVVANQLQIMSNLDTVPQAAVILKNLLEYASITRAKTKTTGAIVDDNDKALLDKIMLSYKEGLDADIIIVSASLLTENVALLKEKVQNGAKVLVLPCDKSHEKALCELFGEAVTISERYCYELKADYSSPLTKGISVVDLFGFDKPVLSQRTVTNEKLAYNSLTVPEGRNIITSVDGTIWEDVYVNGYGAEFCKRALVEFNRLNKKETASFMVSKESGHGEVVAIQFRNTPDYIKTLHVYTKVLDNLGASFNDNSISHIKGEAENSLEMIMALPYMPYQDFDRAFEYYSDPEFSLNNLGEGLYGWMKKTERNPEDGYLYIANSKNKTMFMSAFIHSLKSPADSTEQADEKEYFIDIDASRPYTLYINGEKITSRNIILKKGINRLFILSDESDTELKLRINIKNTDESYATNLQYRLTVDEVDPK